MISFQFEKRKPLFFASFDESLNLLHEKKSSRIFHFSIGSSCVYHGDLIRTYKSTWEGVTFAKKKKA